jgi:hypothetical protein
MTFPQLATGGTVTSVGGGIPAGLVPAAVPVAVTDPQLQAIHLDSQRQLRIDRA